MTQKDKAGHAVSLVSVSASLHQCFSLSARFGEIIRMPNLSKISSASSEKKKPF
jgi:hypothetical protein